MAAVLVKEESEDEDKEALAEPSVVSPCVVLEKLEELLSDGRVMLRFSGSGDKAWGINGKLGREWRSFRAEPDTTCRFTDDMVWSTDDREGWADGELQTLEKLHEQALKIPASSSSQPSALNPRQCRRAVFDFHKAQYEKAYPSTAKKAMPEKRQAVAAAKAADSKPKSVIAKVTSKIVPLSAAAKAKSTAARCPSGTTSGTATNQACFDAFLEKVLELLPDVYDDFLLAESEGAERDQLEEMLAEHPGLLADFRQLDTALKAPPTVTASEFLATAKKTLLEANQKDRYRHLIAAVSKKADEVVGSVLSDYPDLLSLYRQLRQPKANPNGGANGHGHKAAAHPAEKKQAVIRPSAPKVQQPPKVVVPSPPRTPLTKAISFEDEFLRPSRQRGGDAATQLVNIVFQQRGAPASLRVAALRYARMQATPKESFRKLVILRGPPGCGKSQWAMEQLRLEAFPSPDEELAARFIHICAVDDFHTVMKAEAKHEETFTPSSSASGSEAAFARNEARVKLAMEVGIQPLLVDACHTQLWEMSTYVRLAKESGYDVVFVDPSEICMDWDKLDVLQERNSAEGRPASKISSLDALKAALYHFERLPEIGEEAEGLVLSCRPGAPRPGYVAPAQIPEASLPAKNGPKRPIATECTRAMKASRVASATQASADPESRVASSFLTSLLKKTPAY